MGWWKVLRDVCGLHRAVDRTCLYATCFILASILCPGLAFPFHIFLFKLFTCVLCLTLDTFNPLLICKSIDIHIHICIHWHVCLFSILITGEANRKDWGRNVSCNVHSQYNSAVKPSNLPACVKATYQRRGGFWMATCETLRSQRLGTVGSPWEVKQIYLKTDYRGEEIVKS